MRRLVLLLSLVVLLACARRQPPAPAVEMVPIRAGFFWQGCSPADEQCDEPEKPGRAVELPAFRIGKLEVTQQQYDGCVSAGRCTAPTADFDPLPKQADTFRGFRCAAAE